MIKSRKRIATILIGLLLVAASIVWMKYGTSDTNPIPAFVFAAGVIAILETAKRTVRDLARKQEPSRANKERQE